MTADAQGAAPGRGAPDTDPAAAKDNRRRRWFATAAVAGVLLVLALAPRVLALSRFITWDELFWTRAALKFNREIDGADWRDTYIIGQPGVVTMWLGTLAVRARSTLAPAGAWDEALAAGQLKYRDDDQATLRRLVNLWRGLPLVTALFSSLAIVAAWLLLRGPWGDGPALAGAVLLAVEPFFIAHSRVLALDAVLASLCLLSLACLVRYAAWSRWRDLVPGAALAGLAVVQKVPAIGIVAWGCAVVAWTGLRSQGVGRAVGVALLWSGVALLTAVLAWPALWVEPVETISKIITTLRTYEGSAYDSMYFLGRAGEPPGPQFYPMVLAYRSSPLLAVGLALLAWRALRRDRVVPWRGVGVFAGFSLVFMILLSWPATKFDRYLLPALLPLVVVAGLGWWYGLAALRRRVGFPWRAGWLPVGLAAGGLALLALAAPADYLAWYNPVADLLRPVEEVLPIGWGEGSEQIVRYLDTYLGPDRPTGATSGTVAANGMASLAAAQARIVPAQGEACRTADAVVVTAFDRQLGRPVARAYAEAQPVFVAMAAGRPSAWIYAGGRACPDESAGPDGG
jgi:hypothetical protein